MDEQNPTPPQPEQPAVNVVQQPAEPSTPTTSSNQSGKGDGIIKNIMSKLKVVVIFIGSIIIGGLLFYAGYVVNQQINNPNPQPEATPTPTMAQTEEPTPTIAQDDIPDRGHRFVAYIKDDEDEPNVWIVDNNGTNRRNISQNTDRNTTFPDVKWHSFDTVGYAFCPDTQDSCGVKTYSIYFEQEQTLLAPGELPSRSTILAIDFDDRGQQLAYLYTTADGRAFIQLVKDDNIQTLKELPASLGRGGTLDDEVSLEFSPDGRHLLAIDTLTQPNTTQNYQTLWVFETATGSEIISEGRQNTFATMGNWISNDFILFKRGNQLIRKNIASGGETLQVEFIDKYNPDMSDASNDVVFWSYPVNRRTELGTFNLDSRRFFSHTIDVFRPQWFNREQVVGIGTEETSGAVTFVSTGRLLLVNINTNSLFELDATDVTRFAVEPLQF